MSDLRASGFSLRREIVGSLFESLSAKTANGLVNVIIDTPKGSRNKFKFDEQVQCFRLSRILPLGACFPYDFGGIPGTAAEDGDPLDVLVIAQEGSFVGCLLTAKLIDRKSTRLNSSHSSISYAVFCLKKKKYIQI